jgi:hypothetical protein
VNEFSQFAYSLQPHWTVEFTQTLKEISMRDRNKKKQSGEYRAAVA